MGSGEGRGGDGCGGGRGRGGGEGEERGEKRSKEERGTQPFPESCVPRIGRPVSYPKHEKVWDICARRLMASAAFDHAEPPPFTTEPANAVARRRASTARARASTKYEGVGRGQPRHARPRAPHEPTAAPAARRRGEPRKRRRGGKAGSRRVCLSGRGRAGHVRATRRRSGRITQASLPRLVSGEWVDPMMLGEDARSALAKSLSDSTSGPGRRAVAATAGVPRRRLVRAHAQRRRLCTTRVAARPSEEQRDDERHADSAIRVFLI